MPQHIALKTWRQPKSAAYQVLDNEPAATHGLSDDQPKSSDFPGWPAEPQSVDHKRRRIVGEEALLVLPTAFIGTHYVSTMFLSKGVPKYTSIALAAIAWSFHGNPISADGKILQRVILLGPTLFPLAFAALGGRSMRNIALWKAERGASIAVSWC